MAAGRVKTKLEKTGEIVAYSEAAVRNNAAVLEYCRTSMAALSGGTAGLLGLTSFYGFAFYVFAVVGLWGLILVKAGSQWKKYFISRKTILTHGFFGGLFTYVLFWTKSSWGSNRVASLHSVNLLATNTAAVQTLSGWEPLKTSYKQFTGKEQLLTAK